MCAISYSFSENKEELYFLLLFLFSYLSSDKQKTIVQGYNYEKVQVRRKNTKGMEKENMRM